MGLASLDGVPFRIDPHTVTWSYSIKASQTQTVGGMVVQVYGATLGDMVVQGAFGKGGWEEQAAFFNRITALAEKQIGDITHFISTVAPLRFLYPSYGWDFLVYLKAYGRVPGGRSVLLDNEEFSPKWALTLFMVEDNVGLKKVAQDQFIARLSEGIGWVKTGDQWPNEYNGPLGFDDVVAAMGDQQGATNVVDYLAKSFGISGSTPTGGTGSQ